MKIGYNSNAVRIDCVENNERGKTDGKANTFE